VRATPFVIASLVVVVLASTPALASFPGENGEIAFYRYDRSAHALRTVHPDGAHGKLITRDRSFDDLEWSPDGQSYVLSGYGGAAHIVVVDADSGASSPVIGIDDVPGGYRVIESVAYGPSGDAIAFCAFREQGNSLFTIDIDGTNLALISDRNDCYADWSTTDRIVAVHGNRRIVTMDPDGGNRQAIARATSYFGHGLSISPSWSPDGSRIVYSSENDGHRHDLFVVDGDGTDLTQLTDSPRRSEYAPLFSPDGSAVAFTRTRGAPFRQWTDLFVLEVDGSGFLRLTDTPKRKELTRSWQALVP
jgi:Tol biopolymer transport system component